MLYRRGRSLSPNVIKPQPAAFHVADVFDRSFWHQFGISALEKTARIAGIIVVYLLLRAVIRRLIDKVIIPVVMRSEQADGAHAGRLRTLAGLLNSVTTYLLAFIFGIMLLSAIGLDPVPLLTTASVAGLAVGFGAQKLVKDVISGFFILLENQYAVGEYVTIGAVTGVVEEVGMRTTRLRDDVGKLYLISNGDITQVCNQSRGPVATFIEVGVAPNADIPAVTAIIDKSGKEISEREDLSFVKPPTVQGISAVDGTKITLRVTCATVNPQHLVDAQVALRSLIHKDLAEAGITLA